MEKTNGRLIKILSAFLISAGLIGAVISFNMEETLQTSDANEKTRVSFALYGDTQMQQIAEEAAAVFQKQRACTVDIYCYSTEEELTSNILGQIAGGNPFDLFYISPKLLEQLAEKEELQPLENIVEKRQQEGERFYEPALASGQYNGRQYALPVGVDPYMIYINRTMMAEEGIEDPQLLFEKKEWNLDGFASCVREIKEKTGMAGLNLYPDWYVAEPFLRCNGGYWVREEEQIIPDEAMGQTLEILKKLKQEGALGMLTEAHYESLQQKFLSGELPMIIGKLDMTRVCGQMDFAWDIVPFPSASCDFSNGSMDVSMIAVGNGKHAKEAEAFADFYVSTFGQKIRLEQGECLLPSLSMVFYTSMGDVVFPEHSNYYIFSVEKTYMDSRTAEEKEMIEKLWRDSMGEGG